MRNNKRLFAHDLSEYANSAPAGGGTASRLAVETIRAALLATKAQDPGLFGSGAEGEENPLPDRLREAVDRACAVIFEAAQADAELAGMGTTVTAALLDGRSAFVAHVGDSRAYLLRGGHIYQVTKDHSLVAEQLRLGAISADEAKHSRFKNIITRSVGFEREVLVDLMGLELEGGDALVVCCTVVRPCWPSPRSRSRSSRWPYRWWSSLSEPSR